MYISMILVLVVVGLTIPIMNVSAGGPRQDYPEDGDAPQESNDCWVNGYDSGFAGKFDKDRNDECQEEDEDNYYIFAWAIGCEDGHHNTTRTMTGRSVWECIKIMNNPVEIEDYEPLIQEINTECRADGEQDYEDGEPFHKERSSACNEYGRLYEEGYKSKCLENHTEGYCMIQIREAKNYCPFNRDVPECADFLQNATKTN